MGPRASLDDTETRRTLDTAGTQSDLPPVVILPPLDFAVATDSEIWVPLDFLRR
jgi:hypothetical protein